MDGNETSQNRNAAFDLLKGIGCISVVFIHVLFPGRFGRVVLKLAEFAVPSFLMISGYFAFECNGPTEKVLKKRAIKTFKLSLFACGFYFFYIFTRKLIKGEALEWVMQFASIKKWIGILLFSDFDCIGAGHLWYLPSLLIVYLITMFIDKHSLYSYAYRFIPILFLGRTVVYIITLSYGLSWHLRGNFLVDALPWFLLGHYLAAHPDFLNKLSDVVIWMLVLLGGGVGIAFKVFDLKIDLSEIGITLYATGLFLISIRHINISRNRILEEIGQKYSANVYVFHVAIGSFLSIILKLARADDCEIIMWAKPLIVVLLSLLWSRVLFAAIGFLKLKRQQFDKISRGGR